jgi:voltage-gated potassium channel
MPEAQQTGPIARWVANGATREGGLKPRHAAYAIVTFWLIAVVVFGVLERIVDPTTFHSVWLGMWWGVETVTTVGYGDIVPNGTVGKVLASFLMLGGLSLLSIIIATITSSFVARRQEELRASIDDPVLIALAEVTTRLEAIEQRLGRGGEPPQGA